MSESVLQSWVEKMPIRMQSTLILSLRGPDTHTAPGVKALGRWMRGLAFKPGNPANVAEFMGPRPPRIQEKDSTAKELEFCTQHYFSHLMHGLEVIGYRHPDGATASHALGLFRDMAALMHLPVESREDFQVRLGVLPWPKGQPDTFDDAMEMIR